MASNLPRNLPLVHHKPISEKLTRERTFALIQHRPDFLDVVGQFVLVLGQLHAEQFTGSWTINFNQGSVTNTKTIETTK